MSIQIISPFLNWIIWDFFFFWSCVILWKFKSCCDGPLLESLQWCPSSLRPKPSSLMTSDHFSFPSVTSPASTLCVPGFFLAYMSTLISQQGFCTFCSFYLEWFSHRYCMWLVPSPCLCVTGNWTQGLALAPFYHLDTSSALSFLFCSWDSLCPGWPWTWNPPASTF
jgi:hypothetical protein